MTTKKRRRKVNKTKKRRRKVNKTKKKQKKSMMSNSS